MLDSLVVHDGTLAGIEVVSFCWGEKQGAVKVDAESLSLFYRSSAGHMTLASWEWNETDSAEQEEPFVELSWISPSSLSDKAMAVGCSASFHKPEHHPAEATCSGLYNLAE